jgi:hypothetical protein
MTAKSARLCVAALAALGVASCSGQIVDVGGSRAVAGGHGGADAGVQGGADAQAQGGLDTGAGSPCLDTMADAHNCGACGHDCGGGACVAGRCQSVVLVSAPTGPFALDATSIYFAEPGPWNSMSPVGVIMKVAKAGGPVTTLASGRDNPGAVAVDATHVYWTEATGLYKLPLSGGATPVALDAYNMDTASIAADSKNVYWDDGTGEVVGIPIAGGTLSIFSPVPQQQTFPAAATTIAVDPSNLYWMIGHPTTSVMREAIGGGTAAALVTSNYLRGLAVDGADAYYADDSVGTIMRVAIDGGTPTTLASDQTGPAAIALDPDFVYWTNAGQAESPTGAPIGPSNATGLSVMKVSRAGGPPVTLESNQNSPGFIAVDATSVYFCTADSLRKIAK